MCLDETKRNFGIHQSHYYDVNFLPVWKNKPLRILAPELQDVLPQLPEEAQGVERDAPVVRSGKVFLLSDVENVKSKRNMSLVDDIEELEAPVGVYISDSVDSTRAEEFLKWILTHNCDPTSLTVFRKGWEISNECCIYFLEQEGKKLFH